MDAAKVSWRLVSLAFVINIIIFFITIIFIIIIMFYYTILVSEWMVIIIIIIIIILLLPSHHSCTELIKSFRHMLVILIIPASKCWHACPFVSTNFYCELIDCLMLFFNKTYKLLRDRQQLLTYEATLQPNSPEQFHAAAVLRDQVSGFVFR